MLIMESKRKILVRYRRGDGIRAISRELNISRNTVRDIIRSKGNIKSDYVRVIQPTPRLGDYTEKLEKMLRDNKHSKPKKTGKILFEELQIYGYQGSYSAVSRYIYAWKEKTLKLTSMLVYPYILLLVKLINLTGVVIR